MKKIISLVIIIVFGLFLITGCSTKKALNSIDFVDLAEQKGYITTNVIGTFEGLPQVKNSFLVQNKAMTYQIEYYELDTITSAKKVYDENVKLFKKQGKIKSKSNINLDNYQKYTQSTNSVYSLISRIDNTVVYAVVNIEYKDEINKFIETIGY